MAAAAPLKLEHPRPAAGGARCPTGSPATRGRTTRDWIVDVSLLRVAALLGALVFAEELRIGDPPGWLLAADVLAGVVACCALWVRRRWPVGVALALLALSSFSAAAAVASLIAFFTVAVHRRFACRRRGRRRSGSLVAPVYVELHPDPETPYALALAFAITLTLAAAAWGMFVRARRQLVLSLRDRAERAEAAAAASTPSARASWSGRGSPARCTTCSRTASRC